MRDAASAGRVSQGIEGRVQRTGCPHICVALVGQERTQRLGGDLLGKGHADGRIFVPHRIHQPVPAEWTKGTVDLQQRQASELEKRTTGREAEGRLLLFARRSGGTDLAIELEGAQ